MPDFNIWHRGRSHRRPNRSGSPNRRRFASLNLKTHPDFSRFQIKRMCFRIASRSEKKKLFRIASDLGVSDSNRIAHRGCIVRFGPLSFSPFTCCFRRFFGVHSRVFFATRTSIHTITLMFTIHYLDLRANGSLITETLEWQTELHTEWQTKLHTSLKLC